MSGGDAVPKFARGDLVWAKMKGFSPWPGLVSIFSPRLKKPPKKSDTHCIFFFGTRNYAYIEEANIMPYEEYKNKLVNSCKSASFKEAINEIERFIKKTVDDPNFDAAKFDPSEDFDDLFDCIRDSEGKPASKNKKESTGVGTKRASTNTPKSASKKRKSAEENDSSLSPLPLANHISKKNYEELLNRPLVDRPRSPQLDISNVSENLKSKHIEASTKTFGFIGLGLMGSGIVKNLINSGHKINLWNRSIRKAEEVKSQADLTQPGQVKVWSVPCDVVYNSDIIFCCVSDPRAAKNIVYANCGVLYQAEGGCALEGKGYVELTSIDTETSKDLSNVITSKGGRYLEAQLQGSKEEADNGSLIVLGAGDKTLFDDCQSCFQAMGKTAFYLGEVGYASKMNLILQVMRGVALAGLAEGFVLADRSGLSLKDVMEIFSITSMSSPALLEKAKIIIDQDFRNPRMPLQHMQKDLKLALELSDSLQQPMLLASTANEIYKHARRLGYDKHDSAVVYMRARH